MIVPAANTKPQKRSSNLIAQILSVAQVPSAPDGCAEPRHIPAVPSTQSEPVAPPGPANPGDERPQHCTPLPAKIASFYVQTEAPVHRPLRPAVAPAILVLKKLSMALPMALAVFDCQAPEV